MIDYVTVEKLIEILNTCNPSDRIMLGADSGGNKYHPLRVVERNSSYDPAWAESGYRKLTDELRQKGYDENDVVDRENSFHTVTLCP